MILETILLAGFEALLFMLITLGFNLKSLARDRLVLTWIALSLIIKGCQVFLFGIPIITQLSSVVLCSLVISIIHRIKFTECLKKCLILVFCIMLVSELIWYVVLASFINLDIYTTLNVLQKFIYGLVCRILELSLIYLYIKGVFRIGILWFIGKEEKEVEVAEDEETEE